MKSQSNEYPSVIERLDSTTYVFNYNIVEKQKEDIDGTITYYEYDQIVVNSDNVNDNDITRNTILENWDINQQLKLVNDYMAYQLGILTDEKYKQRYEDFLYFRASFKDKLIQTVWEQ